MYNTFSSYFKSAQAFTNTCAMIAYNNYFMNKKRSLIYFPYLPYSAYGSSSTGNCEWYQPPLSIPSLTSSALGGVVGSPRTASCSSPRTTFSALLAVPVKAFHMYPRLLSPRTTPGLLLDVPMGRPSQAWRQVGAALPSMSFILTCITIHTQQPSHLSTLHSINRIPQH